MQKKSQRGQERRSPRKRPDLILIISLIAVLFLTIIISEIVKDPVTEVERFDRAGSLDAYIKEATGRSLQEIEEELELPLTIHEFSDDIHDAGQINYDYLELTEPAGSTLPRIDILMRDGYELSKDYSDCRVSLSGAGEYDFLPQSAQVRIRGNWTSKYEKKPLKIKFNASIGLFGMNPEKSWTLIANFMDNTQIHNYISYDLYDYVTPEGQYVPFYTYVNLYINDVYIGLYALSDQIETGSDRISINDVHMSVPSMNDFLVEQDYRLAAQEPEGEDVYWFWSRYNDLMYSIKSPEDKVTGEDLAYMRDYLDCVYILARLGDYERLDGLIDLESFMNFFMVQDIIRNSDVFKASVFYCKRAGGKLYCPTIWDCDLTFGGHSLKPDGMVCLNNQLFAALIEVPEFRDMYIDNFLEKKEDIKSHMMEEIDHITSLYGEDFANEYYNWEIGNTEFMLPEMNGVADYGEEIELMKQWLSEQLDTLEMQYTYMR